MNKFAKCLSVLFVAMGLVLFCGCIRTLDAPVIIKEGMYIKWSAQNAKCNYKVNINDTEFTTSESKFNIIPYIKTGANSIKVKAVSQDNVFISDSEYSNVISVMVADTKLSTPENFSLTLGEQAYMLNWSAVPLADYYMIKTENVDSGEIGYIFTVQTSRDIMQDLNDHGNYNISVAAVSDALDQYAPSEYTQIQTMQISAPLSPAENLKISRVGSNYKLTFDAVEGAQGYLISALNTNQTLESNSNNVDITALITSPANFINVQALAGNSLINRDSAFSNMASVFTTTSKADFHNIRWDYLGSPFDLVANTQEELNDIIRFAVYYRIEQIKFYIDYSPSNTANALRDAFKSYTDIMAIQHTHSINTAGMCTINIDYFHSNSPTERAQGDRVTVQFDKVQPQSYAQTNLRASDFNDFKINERTLTKQVYTSDQLYLAVENGFKPEFISDSSPAKMVWVRALKLMRNIVNDDMTDYQKVLAIYDWLTYEVKYDNNLYDTTIQLEDSSNMAQVSLSNYKGFYIEGVLMDNGQAVCDGIAKTFSLLCNIEGIECYKVSGTVNGGGHAWNKVKIAIGNTPASWYTVDATWGDVEVETSVVGNTADRVEMLAHNTFLRTDSWFTEFAYHVETSPQTHNSTTFYSYFTTQTYTYNGVTRDFYIESSGELSHLLNYFNNASTANSIEFKVDGVSNVTNYIRSILGGRVTSVTYEDYGSVGTNYIIWKN